MIEYLVIVAMCSAPSLQIQLDAAAGGDWKLVGIHDQWNLIFMREVDEVEE